MNYDKIILEMLSRIKDLEEKVNMLEDYHQEQQNKDEEEIEVTSSKNKERKESGRTRTRKEIMSILKENFNLNTRIGNRSEGSGVVILKEEENKNVKVSYSRSYISNEDVLCSGWHTLFEEEIENTDLSYFVFAVEDEESKFHYFIFAREDLINEFEDKAYDANRKLHFYFRVNRDGTPIESREIDKNMRRYYNNWDIFKE
ncbi:hypothetical protein P7H33_06820 [Vagococcus lutrae]|jgi:hypothetical protein|uniref:hypothetical protein n=1 Tax=Vagococcus lutrae TaxID=81947 RepID=UPI0028911E0E|nr:hypothetical protein [Vagococcus lutrae]MDT2812656.1 hypothetical protein [Vagococcus lutrae]